MQDNIKAYQHLYEIENNLRLLILNKLSNHKNWWKDLRQRPPGLAVENIKEHENKLLGIIIDNKIKNNFKKEKQSLILRHEIYYTQIEHLKNILFYYWEIEPKFHEIFSDNKNTLNIKFESIKHKLK